MQHNALIGRLIEFPDTKFIIWTGATLVEKATNPEEANRAKDITSWVTDEWDCPRDSIYIFDFRQIETKWSLYLKAEYAYGDLDSHLNEILAIKAAELFVNRIVDVIENLGTVTTKLLSINY